ncbi:tyrosine-type recombinase/integrase [Pseudomonas fluorescens]|uniref:tyrosine-type recombinase/integrase n=1 Tax=Pseudomonas fluorescens TaxID=294 RepID=UPI003822E9A1
MRPSEIAVLRWEEVDKEKRLVNVCRIVADYKIEERTKTRNVRQVMLNSRALHAFEQAELEAQQRAVVNAPNRPTCPANQELRVHSTIECDRQTLPGCTDRIGDSRPPAIQLPTHIRYHVPHGGYEPCVYCHSARS